MNECENKTQCAGQESASAKAKVPGIGDLLGILGALGGITESDRPVNTLDIEDFVTEFDCKFGSTPDNLKFFVMPMEDFEKLWSRARAEVRASLMDKYAKPKVPAYSEQEALHTVFSAARKAKMDAFIAQHGNNAFNTYDAWQKLGFQVRQGETGITAGTGGLTANVRIFHLGQTVAKVPSVPLADVTLVIAKFCEANGIWGVDAIKAAYPWTDKYFGKISFQQRNVSETGEII